MPFVLSVSVGPDGKETAIAEVTGDTKISNSRVSVCTGDMVVNGDNLPAAASPADAAAVAAAVAAARATAAQARAMAAAAVAQARATAAAADAAAVPVAASVNGVSVSVPALHGQTLMVAGRGIYNNGVRAPSN